MKMNGTGPGRTALILYGTETGTSQDVAEEVGRLTQRLHFNTDVAGFEDVAITELPKYTVTIFVIATTGQGEFPSNALSFWRSLLKKKLSNNFFSGVQYVLAGLGDSSYSKYNWAGRKLDKRLQHWERSRCWTHAKLTSRMKRARRASLSRGCTAYQQHCYPNILLLKV